MIPPMRTAMVLCAGLGTRLRPLTDHLPKPLMPVGDRPALAHVLGAIRSAGIDRIAVNTHHRAEAFDARRAELGIGDLSIVHEPEILGTAGGVRNARVELGEGDVLVYNGDIVAPALDIRALVSEWEECGDAAALWVVKPRTDGKGTVGIDDAGGIVRLRGCRFGKEARSGDYLGIQMLGKGLREALPEAGCLVGDVAMPFLGANGRIATFTFDAEWDDIGDVDGLLRANVAWLERRGAPAWAGPGASIDPAVTLLRSVVGAGAVVEGRGELRDCVVFAGAHACAPIERAIVSPAVSVRI
jgi:mannose-1-phosphate guanylyltransferase